MNIKSPYFTHNKP